MKNTTPDLSFFDVTVTVHSLPFLALADRDRYLNFTPLITLLVHEQSGTVTIMNGNGERLGTNGQKRSR